MGLVFETSAWANGLWSGHCKASRIARQTLLQGTDKQQQFPQLAHDLHSMLYLRHEPARQENAPDWATSLLDQAHDLAEYAPLRARCARNGFAAGVACETLLQALLPLLPEAPKTTPRQTRQRGQDGTPGIGQESVTGEKENPASEDASAVRRALRQAMRQAQDAVDEAEVSIEAMGDAMGLQAGTGPGHAETLHDIEQVRQLWALLRDNPTMRHIAEMAGRLQRLGRAHKKCQVTPAIGRIKGITVGGDLDRLLPAELAGLRSANRLQRLSTLSKIMGKRAMQYEMQGEDSETRGPILVLLDESGSMQGDAEQWSKAVALALLATATEQKRAWWLCGFSDRVTHQHLLRHGEAGTDTLLDALAMRASGGTAFDPPLNAALRVLTEKPELRKADIILVTDGEAPLSDNVAAAVNQHRKEHGLHVYVIGIGGIRTKILSPIADAIYTVSGGSQERDGATVAPVVALTA